ncbi:hypothetical protein MUK42_25385 [Musa troglodytarum]|uniref:Uncharacterized protein n=1 Tax=Musa troglodytarum TaxID=320322 RepID=A0A9E7FGU3_9LILI|nr:hypothetical protein MUK42_25385 [Musa troglodytarum]
MAADGPGPPMRNGAPFRRFRRAGSWIPRIQMRSSQATAGWVPVMDRVGFQSIECSPDGLVEPVRLDSRSAHEQIWASGGRSAANVGPDGPSCVRVSCFL